MRPPDQTSAMLGFHRFSSYDVEVRIASEIVRSAKTIRNQALPKTGFRTCNAIQENRNELDRTRDCGKPQECKTP
jgi:hypothetical protein